MPSLCVAQEEGFAPLAARPAPPLSMASFAVEIVVVELALAKRFALAKRLPPLNPSSGSVHIKNKNGLFRSYFFGAGRGIRTPVGFHPNGFQDRLVMTASIFLQLFNYS